MNISCVGNTADDFVNDDDSALTILPSDVISYTHYAYHNGDVLFKFHLSFMDYPYYIKVTEDTAILVHRECKRIWGLQSQSGN